MTRRRHTDVRIERVTVRGIPLRADQSELLRRAIETEIAARLTAAPLTAPRATRTPATRQTLAPVNWTPGDATQLGRDIGQAVHRTLGS
jgi:hypothetical protein